MCNPLGLNPEVWKLGGEMGPIPYSISPSCNRQKGNTIQKCCELCCNLNIYIYIYIYHICFTEIRLFKFRYIFSFRCVQHMKIITIYLEIKILRKNIMYVSVKVIILNSRC